MLRRFIACLMAFTCLFAVSARAAGLPDVADLPIVSQWDDRFQDETFRYGTTYFRYGGCGPSSITNGIIAALGVTDQEMAAGLLHDVLFLLSKNQPTKNRAQVSYISYLSATQGQLDAPNERYSFLNQAVRDFGGSIIYHNRYISAKTLPDLLPAAGGGPAVLHGSFTSDNRWTAMRELIQALTDSGYEDARIVLSFLGAGTADTRSPFRSGTAGHYLSICISMAEFLQTGEFYVLDSLPRALFGEDYGEGKEFITSYDFVGKQSILFPLDDFNSFFRVERVTPTIVRVVPTGEAKRNVKSAQQNGTIPLDALLPALNLVMQFHGTSHIFITLPEQ